jgi:epoxyqueuosine reductase QueG
MRGWSITLEKVLRIPSNRQFERFFGTSGLLRPGRRGLVRNACAVAGNLKRKDLVPLLEKLAGDERESGVLRRSAAWALERMGRVERPVFSAKERVA